MARRAIGAVVIVVIAAAAAIWWSSLGGNGPRATAQTGPPLVPVTAGTVVARDFPVFLQGIGTVQAYNTVTVESRVDGQIVKVDFKEGQDELRQEQKKAPLAVDAYAAENTQLLATGQLTLIDNTIDKSTGTIRLKARFDNADERLWPGEFVNVRVIQKMRHQVPTVPAQTLQQGPDGSFAYVIKPDNSVERRTVEVAAVQDGISVVGKGLRPGERIVVDGQYRLNDGARVRLLGAARPPTG